MVAAWAWEDEAAAWLRARMFPNGVGIEEDEATGAAAMQFGALLGRESDSFGVVAPVPAGPEAGHSAVDRHAERQRSGDGARPQHDVCRPETGGTVVAIVRIGNEGSEQRARHSGTSNTHQRPTRTPRATVPMPAPIIAASVFDQLAMPIVQPPHSAIPTTLSG
jgi:hypothetical protein